MLTKNATIPNKDVEQHTLAKSILLHLLPGFFLTIIFIIAVPFAVRRGIPSFLVLMIAGLLFLIPFELGYLLYQAKKRNGSFSLKGIVVFRQPIPVWQYLVLTFLMLGWVYFAFMIVFAPFEKPIIDTFFSWVPDMYFVESFFNQIDQYSRFLLITTAVLGFFFNGLIGPVVEELYFRGFLLPRISRLGRWAPLLNTVLFSLYHFFTPWQNPVRILALTPLYYAVWWKKNIYLGMIVHCLINIIAAIFLMVAVLKLV